MRKARWFFNLIIALSAGLVLCSCQKDQKAVDPVNENIIEPASKFVYSDTCTIVSINKGEDSFTFQNLETGLRYTLSYNNLTFFTDRHGEAITAGQLGAGGICNITFYREDKLLKTLEIAPEYFAYSNVEGFRFYNSATRMEYLGDKYVLDDNLVVCSGRENIDVLEISDSDVLTLHGTDHVIYSISVDKGHGYLSLENDAYFIDGFIEIEKDIRKITEDMVITVPEGRYDILISKDGTSAVKEVTVGRNQEAKLDLGDIEIKKNYGNITFSVEPSNALLYIDGVRENDYSKPVRMEYGIHEIIIRADGYETASKFISVGSSAADVAFKLTKLTDDDKEESKENDSKADNTSSNETGGSGTTDQNSPENGSENGENKTSAKVYIDAPSGAELYLDGNYVGVVPASFDKKVGTIVITLKKEGCQTRSYTINLEEASTDSRYSFSDLLKLE